MAIADYLDTPFRASLWSHHEGLSVGGPLARRYAPSINVFASAIDDSADALAALTELAAPGDRIVVLQVPAIALPPGLSLVEEAAGVQMVASRRLGPATAASDDIVRMTDSDAAEMLALAKLTEPGPFLAQTHRMGRFLGIRREGRLAAMAGERCHFPGHTEISGVCTHPDFRGLGLARRLSAAVAANIEARGETPFLHSWKKNHAAISLYESLGFRLRADVQVAVFERPTSGAQQ